MTKGFVVRVLALGILVFGVPVVTSAQSAIEIFPRAAFWMDAEHLRTDQLRFKWDANFHGEVDLIGWRNGGRFTFLANYEVVLGDELRRFDPNQGNYTLDGAITQRVAGLDLSLVFHHISRHLSDRPKTPAVDWNMLGGRVGKTLTAGSLSAVGHIGYFEVLQRSRNDYERELEGAAHVRYVVRSPVDVISSVVFRVVGVDGSLGRGTQSNVRAEGGISLTGRSGHAIELFLAAEHRLDPYPIEFGTINWVSAGFRFRN